ncbi:DUF2087 domain-containing protein [Glutamicibacter protophormiae]|uniref:DUF2087 domain-containing protein n=1 Tax=Kocuria sp. TaxID=1871328 RepID=UPI002648C51C|nr:DUF2087 domain-containing protein [Kocuria sp.]MDN5630350.1 DUF2087 domain-containing protein [Kocuria sp.]WNB89227.1 DUF2087 domain-containing protein [Glutamicibacter protophormiae]
MTHDSDFKSLVRARMRATGQNYTAARADLLRERDDAAAAPLHRTQGSPASGPAEPLAQRQPPTARATGVSRRERPAESAAAGSSLPHQDAASAADGHPASSSSAPPVPDGVDPVEWERAHAEYRRVLGRFVRDGRVHTVPARRRARVFVLLHLLAAFPAGHTWSEVEVNAILRTMVEDQAFWRRELVEYGYLQREAGVYWLPARVPERSASMRQETPAWEDLWLPVHLGLSAP